VGLDGLQGDGAQCGEDVDIQARERFDQQDSSLATLKFGETLQMTDDRLSNLRR